MVWVRAEPNFRPGFGSRRRISPIMSVMSSSSTPHSFRKRGDIALGQQIQMFDQRLHRGVIAIEFAELDREALAQIPRANAGRIEFLQYREHRIDILLRCTEPLGGLSQIGGNVAGLVDQIDQILSDHALRRRGEGNRQLLGEMAAERHLGGDKGFEIVIVVIRRAAAPFGIGGGCGVLRDARSRFRGLFGKDVVERGVERLLDFGAAAEIAVQPLFLGGFKAVASGTGGHVGMVAAGFVAIAARIAGIGKFGAAPGPVRRRRVLPVRRWRGPAAGSAPVPPRRRPRGRDSTAAAA